MAARKWGLGRLALWLELRGAAETDTRYDLPTGKGPILLIRATPDARIAEHQVRRRLSAARPDLRIVMIGDMAEPNTLPDPGNSLAAAEALITATAPAALLLLGPDLPPALLTAAERHDLPVVLGEARLDPDQTTWGLRGSLHRQLLTALRTVLVTDPASHIAAVRMGADPARVVMTGPVAEIRDPLRCSESERSGFAEMLDGRPAWFAAAVPPDEEQAVLAAHHAALRQSHRALLFLSPRDPARIDALADEIEATGLTVARRTRDEEPTDEVQVMITDGPTEMGLWYRLSPVTYLGGTLMGDDVAARHPFEPAALGSAILHGPSTARHLTEWQQLQGAGASRQVKDADGLAAAVAELSQPDLIATLASNAWTVSTGGADVANRICAPVLDLLRDTVT